MGAAGDVIVDVTASDYSAGIAVFTGAPSAHRRLCAPASCEEACPWDSGLSDGFGDVPGSPAPLRGCSSANRRGECRRGSRRASQAAELPGSPECGPASSAAFVNVSATLSLGAIIQGPIFFELTEPTCRSHTNRVVVGGRRTARPVQGGGPQAIATVSAFVCTENFDCSEVTRRAAS